MFNRESVVQFLKFCVVGCSNFAISYSVYYLLFRSNAASALLGRQGYDAVFANSVGYLAGVLNSYLWNRLWTFKSTEKSQSPGRLLPFFVLNLLCLALSSFAIHISVDVVGWNFMICWLVVMTAATIFNFVACKWFVFRKTAPQDSAA